MDLTGLHQERGFLMAQLDKRGDSFGTLPATLPYRVNRYTNTLVLLIGYLDKRGDSFGTLPVTLPFQVNRYQQYSSTSDRLAGQEG